MDYNDVITWIVGESTSVSDPAFLARCFLLLCFIYLVTAVMHECMSFGK